jgi:hypothetical protein
MSETPALTWLLTDSDDWSHVPLQAPQECYICPFATPAAGEDEPNPADPGEGWYACALLGEATVLEMNRKRMKSTHFHKPFVWGENPFCAAADWAAKGREELAALRAMAGATAEVTQGARLDRHGELASKLLGEGLTEAEAGEKKRLEAEIDAFYAPFYDPIIARAEKALETAEATG